MQSNVNVFEFASYTKPGANVSSWYSNISGRSTIFAGLLATGEYNEETLFYSDNLQKLVDSSRFTVPWLFRSELDLSPMQGQHVFIRTHGITSRADIYLNGNQVACSSTQVGAYGGHQYDVTKDVVSGDNAILIVAYPTDYQKDFAIGFVDWNPSPPDDGTGPWRAIEVILTGVITLSKPTIATRISNTGSKEVSILASVNISNVATMRTPCEFTWSLAAPNGTFVHETTQSKDLDQGQVSTISDTFLIPDAQWWWPAQWGSQSLYHVQASVTVDGTISAISENVAFGVRSVDRRLNSFNDTYFLVNGHPFLVIGAGYTPDIFLRFNIDRLRTQFQRLLDMGLNTIRLEGKQGQPEMYDLADVMGIMILAGWECCDKWEAWPYDESPEGDSWTPNDYQVAKAQMFHEATMMRNHPCMLAFVLGSDYSSDAKATKLYLEALNDVDWTNPVIASVDSKSPLNELGYTGMKEAGTY